MLKFLKKAKQDREENEKMRKVIRRHEMLLERIISKCNEYQKLNCSLSYTGFERIKELASCDINKHYKADFLDPEDIDYEEIIDTDYSDISDIIDEAIDFIK